MRFNLIDVPASQRSTLDVPVAKIRTGEVDGVLLRGFFSTEQMNGLAKELLQETSGIPRSGGFPSQWNAHFVGRALDVSADELDDYCDIAERFSDNIERLFAPTGFEGPLSEALSDLSGIEACIPTTASDRRYAPATIRFLRPGGQIGLHCGNEAMTRAPYDDMRRIVDTSLQLSYFSPIQLPESGGELIVYALRWEDIDESLIDHEGRTRTDDVIEQYERIVVRPDVGDLLVFNGGSFFHRVAIAGGDKPRLTVGGFAGWSRDSSKLYFWS